MKDFFISYNKADKAWAQWIAWQLEKAGYETIIQEWDFVAGSNFAFEMDKATKGYKRTIAVLSPDYLNSKFASAEWMQRFAEDPVGENRLLIPVRVRECELTGLLSTIVHVDLVGLGKEEAVRDLIEKIRKSLNQVGRVPIEEPFFPGDLKQAEPVYPGAILKFNQNKFDLITNIPQNHNPDFVGRQEALIKIKEGFQNDNKGIIIQVITGLGGLGKTQLAIEYSYRFSTNYDIIWWARGEQPSFLAADFIELAKKLNLSLKDDNSFEGITKAVCNWLQTHERWLLVFDNVKTYQDIATFLPVGLSGHILVTSQNPNWDSAMRIPLKPFSKEEAIEYFEKKLNVEEMESAAELADELGFLPLALSLAQAYIDSNGRNCKYYLKLFKTRSKELLNTMPSDNFTKTIGNTWDIAIKAIKKQSPGSEAILRICSFLAPDYIPVSLFTGGYFLFDTKLRKIFNDEIKVNDAIAIIKRYSLVDIHNDNLVMHRLVQVAIRNKLSKREQKSILKLVTKLIDNSLDFLNPRAVWGHIVSIANHIENVGVSSNVLVEVAVKTATYLNHQNDYIIAANLLEEILTMKNINDKQRLKLLRALSANLSNVGEFKKSLTYSIQMVKMIDKFTPASEVAYILSTLGQNYFLTGEIDNSKSTLQAAKKIYENQILIAETKKDDHMLFSLIYDYSDVLVTLGKASENEESIKFFMEAIQHCTNALRIGEKLCDNRSISSLLLKFYNNMALAYYGTGEYEIGIKICKKALKLFVEDNHIEDANIATLYERMALLMEATGKYEETKKYYKLAIDYFNQKQDFRYHEVYVLRKLGEANITLENYQEAINNYSQIIEKSIIEANDLFRRGLAYGCLEMYDEALKDLNKAIELSPNEWEYYNMRSAVYESLKKYEDALGDCNSMVNLQPNNAESYSIRACLYRLMKQFDPAIMDINKAIEFTQNEWKYYAIRGSIYEDSKRYDAALEDCNTMISLQPDNAESYNARANTYKLMEQYDLARLDIDKALQIDPCYGWTYSTLAEICSELGDDEGFYTNIELALKNSAEVWVLLDDRAYTNYKEQARFKELLARYKKEQ